MNGCQTSVRRHTNNRHSQFRSDYSPRAGEAFIDPINLCRRSHDRAMAIVKVSKFCSHKSDRRKIVKSKNQQQ
jgi:hypothetical protein